MKPRVRTRVYVPIAVVLLFTGLSAPASWAAPRRLAVRDLGTFNEFGTTGTALNDRGQVVGVAFVGHDEIRSFLWDGGTMTDLGPGNLAALDINDRGQILLQQYLGNLNDSTSCFLRDGEATINLGSPSGARCFAADLNNLGQVVGTIQQTEGLFPTSYAFLWESGTMTRLGSLGGDYAIATAINDRGQVIGGSTIGPFGEEHAFLWEAGTMTDLETLGGKVTFVSRINNRGEAVGAGKIASGDFHAVLWTK